MSSHDQTSIVDAAFHKRFITSEQVTQLNSELAESPSASASALMLARGLITQEQWKQLNSIETPDSASGNATLGDSTVLPVAPGDDGTGVMTGFAQPTDVTGEFPTGHFSSESEATASGEDSTFVSDIVDGPRHNAAAFPVNHRPVNQWSALQSAPDKRYEWKEEFARGGLGAVWLVRDSNLERQVAVKELLPNGLRSKSAVERFLTEAQVTGQLEHPGIVPVYDAGTKADGCPFYSMKLLDGSPFSDVIAEFHNRTDSDSDREVEFRRLLSIFVGVCHAMEYAHQRRVLHRDLKPQNVVVGNFGEAIVVDWGLAKVLNDGSTTNASEEGEESAVVSPEDTETTLLTGVVRRSAPDKAAQTIAGTVMGTPAYMPPEQARGELAELDHRADIFSLGAILFQLLTGQSPLKGNDLDELLSAAREGRHPAPRSVKPNAPPALNAVCQKAMSAAPADRYQSARELSDEIDRWLASEPVFAWPEPWTVRAQRWIRKHKSLVGSVAGALMVTTAVSVVAAVLIDNSRRAERAAKLQEQTAKQEATASLRVAQDSVDEWLIDVSYSMQWFPELDQPRQQLLESAARHYEEFAAREAEDLPLKIEVAKSNIRLGDVRRLLADWAASKAAFKKAIGELKQLTTENPKNTELQLQLANAHTGLAMLDGQTGEFSSAEASYREASEIFKQLVTDSDDPLLHDGFGRCLNSQALLLQSQRDSIAAEKLLNNAIEQFSKATELDDRLRFARRELSAQLDLGQLLGDRGEDKQAASVFQEVVDSYDKLLAEHTDEPELLHGLATARLSFANSIRHRGDRSVIEAYESAIDTLTTIVERQPRAMYFRENLAIAQLDYAQFQFAVALTHEARETATLALENQLTVVDSDPDIASYHATEATIRHALGEILSDLAEDDFAITALDGAIGKFTELADLFPDIPDYRLRLAESLLVKGQLFTRLEDRDKARLLLDQSHSIVDSLLKDNSTSVPVRFARAKAFTALARLELASNNEESARTYFESSINEFEKLPTQPDYQYEYGWLLVLCEIPEIRDSSKALLIVDRLTTQFSTNANFWNLSAMTSYRENSIKRSIESAETAQQLQLTDDRTAWLILGLNELRDTSSSKSDDHTSQVGIMKNVRRGNHRLHRLKSELVAVQNLLD